MDVAPMRSAENSEKNPYRLLARLNSVLVSSAFSSPQYERYHAKWSTPRMITHRPSHR